MKMFRKGKTGRQRILTRRAEGGRREWGRKLDLKRPFSVSSLTQNNPFVFFLSFLNNEKKQLFFRFTFFFISKQYHLKCEEYNEYRFDSMQQKKKRKRRIAQHFSVIFHEDSSFGKDRRTNE